MRPGHVIALAALVACLAAAGANARLAPLGSPAAAACHNSTSKAECLQTVNCTFCSSTLLPSGCYLDSEAALLPSFAFTCQNGSEPDPDPEQKAPTCALAADQAACGAAGCAWCTSPLLGSACVRQGRAGLLPSFLFTCHGIAAKGGANALRMPAA
ncbi:hypothetical protein HT031_000020 [Scenedesmus sp. PABB004]|nr:hypothetical protein HT031_000020 [Scenedesmus sp. PABB004]